MSDKTDDLRGNSRSLASPSGGEPGDVVEVPLLLSTGQMTALEQAAHRRGLTAGEMLRRLLRDFIGEPAARAGAF
jgi:hypothetical protein